MDCEKCNGNALKCEIKDDWYCGMSIYVLFSVHGYIITFSSAIECVTTETQNQFNFQESNSDEDEE